MSRVFVIQSTKFPPDVSPAQQYGDIVHILSQGDRSSCTPDLSVKKLSRVLESYDPDVDYILWAGGDPASCLLTGIVLSAMDIDSFTYLRYERADPKRAGSKAYYVPVKIDLG